ncbi:Imm52 family immunity protein [Ornithinimicrobium sp. W1665]|uniref:Imm52 family immunity protein n=1 Tax=Ornithinimicrobium sp. W1665 TaxID=3416666 RepID=UPI003CF0DA8A
MSAMYVGAYWGARAEPASTCAARLARCLESLHGAHPALTSWCHKGRSRAGARRPVDVDPGSLTTLVERGRARRDVDDETIDELGFTGGMWNGQTPSVGLTFQCGATFMPIGNNVVLQLSGGGEGETLTEPAVARAVLDSLVNAWEPVWVTWTTDAWRNAQGAEPGRPVVGWLTYLRGVPAYGIPDELASVAMAGGVLVSAAPTFSEVTEERILSVREALRGAGALDLRGGGSEVGS